MHFWQFRLRLQTEPQVSHIYATEMTVRLIIKVNKRSLNYFLPMLDLNHFPSSSTSITQAHDILCVCLLRRHCGCVRFSATYLKCQHSTVLCDRKLNSSVPGFYRCTPHGYAVVASSTVMELTGQHRALWAAITCRAGEKLCCQYIWRSCSSLDAVQAAETDHNSWCDSSIHHTI